ncbi:unnamed protein product [Amoebophrya sp. A120]|nr:unnamed protein product [Amoebophrya sp. A120]|eukprot:GSA120T00015810001.1
MPVGVQLFSGADANDEWHMQEHARNHDDNLVAIWRVGEQVEQARKKKSRCLVIIWVIVLLGLCVGAGFGGTLFVQSKTEALKQEHLAKIQEQEITEEKKAAMTEQQIADWFTNPPYHQFYRRGILAVWAGAGGLLLISLLIAIFCICECGKSETATYEHTVYALGLKFFYVTKNQYETLQAASLSEVNHVALSDVSLGCGGNTTAVCLFVPQSSQIADKSLRRGFFHLCPVHCDKKSQKLCLQLIQGAKDEGGDFDISRISLINAQAGNVSQFLRASQQVSERNPNLPAKNQRDEPPDPIAALVGHAPTNYGATGTTSAPAVDDSPKLRIDGSKYTEQPKASTSPVSQAPATSAQALKGASSNPPAFGGGPSSTPAAAVSSPPAVDTAVRQRPSFLASLETKGKGKGAAAALPGGAANEAPKSSVKAGTTKKATTKKSGGTKKTKTASAGKINPEKAERKTFSGSLGAAMSVMSAAAGEDESMVEDMESGETDGSDYTHITLGGRDPKKPPGEEPSIFSFFGF